MERSEEQKILEVVREICQQLNIPNYNSVAVSWTAFVPTGGRALTELPLDQCHLTWDHVILPQAMKGKLDAYDWKPLLASSLIFSRKLRARIVAGVLTFVAITLHSKPSWMAPSALAVSFDDLHSRWAHRRR